MFQCTRNHWTIFPTRRGHYDKTNSILFRFNDDCWRRSCTLWRNRRKRLSRRFQAVSLSLTRASLHRADMLGAVLGPPSDQMSKALRSRFYESPSGTVYINFNRYLKRPIRYCMQVWLLCLEQRRIHAPFGLPKTQDTVTAFLPEAGTVACGAGRRRLHRRKERPWP